MRLANSAQRIAALIQRYWYLLRGSPPRMLEIAYWPIVDVVLFGFLSQFFAQAGGDGLTLIAATLIGAALLWNVLHQAQLGITLSFLEEIWSRNLVSLFASPLRIWEWLLGVATISVLRASLGLVAAGLVALPLYGFSVFALGLPLLAFFANLLVFGWAIGVMLIGMILRWGQGAEALTWMAVFALMPFCAVFYPVETLPALVQPIANALPPSAVFEGMRALVMEERFDPALLVRAMALNAVYLAAGIGIFLLTFHTARRDGALIQQGE